MTNTNTPDTRLDDAIAELSDIREVINSELAGLESTVISSHEAVEMLLGNVAENKTVIRSVMRRLDNRIERIQSELSKRMDRIEQHIGMND